MSLAELPIEPTAARRVEIRAQGGFRAASVFFLLVAMTILAYLPAMRGGFLWDDDAHVTKPELQSLSGLYRIWFDLGATQQYYPLLHTAFWLEHRLWGDNRLGYHLVNVLFHAAAACLVFVILCRLKIPGALLAAAIFAVHPVEVESVAWISEQKNTLSALFYLGAMLAYLRFDETRKTSFHFAALCLFTLGLLTKTVTATLPAALLVIFWWQRGKLSWRNDVQPLVPFFILGAVAGPFTAIVERKLIGAQGAAFELSFVERSLIAGRAIWFYLGKLFWPTNLIFIYPRWDVSGAVWWQWLFPLAALAVLAVLWGLRKRWRAPLAGALFFVGTLFPVLGFLNVYPFIYSFVADHFQYLASLGVIVPAAAGLTLAVSRLPPRMRWAGDGCCAALVIALSVVTMLQSSMYGNVFALYQTTIARNPDCWMAYNNLGAHRAEIGDNKSAMELYQTALRLKPDYAEALYNLAVAVTRDGRPKDAIPYLQRAIQLRPGYPEAHNNLGGILAMGGEPGSAIKQFELAIAAKPDFAEARGNLANMLVTQGDLPRATQQFEFALRLRPNDAEYHSNFANALLKSGAVDKAIEQSRAALALKPDSAGAHHSLGVALGRTGRLPDAIAQFEEAIRLDPQFLEAYINLTKCYARTEQRDQAIATAKRALEMARSTENNDLGKQIENWLKEYQTKQAAAPKVPTDSHP
jgi:protein O-mannosyl-transferase